MAVVAPGGASWKLYSPIGGGSGVAGFSVLGGAAVIGSSAGSWPGNAKRGPATFGAPAGSFGESAFTCEVGAVGEPGVVAAGGFSGAATRMSSNNGSNGRGGSDGFPGAAGLGGGSATPA